MGSFIPELRKNLFGKVFTGSLGNLPWIDLLQLFHVFKCMNVIKQYFYYGTVLHVYLPAKVFHI